MTRNQKQTPIRESEFRMFLERDFSSKLEEAVLETEIGRRIKMLESLGLEISIRSIVAKYISTEGYTMDSVGNLFIDEQALNEIYITQEQSISETLKFDISRVNDISVLEKIISDPEYKKM